MLSALASLPWRPRLEDDDVPETVECLCDWQATRDHPEAPRDALIWYDVPMTFEPPSHRPRFVIRERLLLDKIGTGFQHVIHGQHAHATLTVNKEPLQHRTPSPPRPRADYKNTEYREARKKRLDQDRHLCVFCKSPATTVQHITYRRAGGNETSGDLRALCRLCHDAVTMIEYGHGMGLDRINPEDLQWRDEIIQKRGEIVQFRSLETRRRKLNREDVE
ncbi:HNH endonuclease [Candidatus Sumerlaeota bacterium]|nr:HNH endonuclease [Candidatus Sumerlaeota bacterium]